jgi:hypothetical protein
MSNLYHPEKSFQPDRPGHRQILQKLLFMRQLIRIYYYNARVGRSRNPIFTSSRRPFSTASKLSLIRVAPGRLVYTNWPSVPPYEKGTDVQLATDMLTHSYKNTTMWRYSWPEITTTPGPSRPLRTTASMSRSHCSQAGHVTELRNVADR